MPKKNYNSNRGIVICFQYSIVAIKITSELKYYIFLGIFSLNLPIQWLLIFRCTLNVGITFKNLNVLCNTYPSQCRTPEFILFKKVKYP